MITGDKDAVRCLCQLAHCVQQLEVRPHDGDSRDKVSRKAADHMAQHDQDKCTQLVQSSTCRHACSHRGALVAGSLLLYSQCFLFHCPVSLSSLMLQQHKHACMLCLFGDQSTSRQSRTLCKAEVGYRPCMQSYVAASIGLAEVMHSWVMTDSQYWASRRNAQWDLM